MVSKLYGVNATRIIFVFVLYCIVIIGRCKSNQLNHNTTQLLPCRVQKVALLIVLLLLI